MLTALTPPLSNICSTNYTKPSRVFRFEFSSVCAQLHVCIICISTVCQFGLFHKRKYNVFLVWQPRPSLSPVSRPNHMIALSDVEKSERMTAKKVEVAM